MNRVRFVSCVVSCIPSSPLCLSTSDMLHDSSDCQPHNASKATIVESYNQSCLASTEQVCVCVCVFIFLHQNMCERVCFRVCVRACVCMCVRACQSLELTMLRVEITLCEDTEATSQVDCCTLPNTMLPIPIPIPNLVLLHAVLSVLTNSIQSNLIISCPIHPPVLYELMINPPVGVG